LANEQRLAIVRLLALAGEQRVATISEAIDLPQANTSRELGVLVANGVLWKRRSGTYVYYSIAESEVDPRRSIIALLASTFRRKQRGKRSLAAIAKWNAAAKSCPSDGEIFAFLTAFTHPRRRQIVRWLAERGASRRLPMARALAMSGNACDRHLTKLLRRGVVVLDEARREQTYCLSPSIGSPFGASLLQAVMKWLMSMNDDPTHVHVRDWPCRQARRADAPCHVPRSAPNPWVSWARD